ncbi:unnamed protein product [Porites lobata]|uniref:Toll-like receptor 4 n=1 Tax=Porites lobata TaxID=104759 RepID=A0ABN8NTT1_9CNID|nr:unnamed protein product [Porites lobata]
MRSMLVAKGNEFMEDSMSCLLIHVTVMKRGERCNSTYLVNRKGDNLLWRRKARFEVAELKQLAVFCRRCVTKELRFDILRFLDNNKIQKLETGAFSGLKKLATLDLSSNNIVDLHAGVFSNLTNLKQLYLQDNKIQKLETGTFSSLTDLNILYLQDNKIQELETGTFSSLTELYTL